MLGEVRTPSRFPASAAGEHLLDTITRAGGPSGQGFDTWVMLERGRRREIVPFGALVYNPSNNIYTHPDDTIYVYREPQTFVAFGATGKQGQYSFDAWRISLAEAVGKATGLDDTRAEPGAVFLYRGEPRAVAERLGIDVSKYNSPIIPIIYNVNFARSVRLFSCHTDADAEQGCPLCVKCNDRRSNEIPRICPIDRRDGQRSDCGRDQCLYPEGPRFRERASAVTVAGGAWPATATSDLGEP